MIKMKSTGGLRKHIRHQTAAVCGNRLWKTEYHDFPGKTLTSSVTLTTVRQMKRKAGLAVEETTASVKAGEGYEITPTFGGKCAVRRYEISNKPKTDVRVVHCLRVMP